MIYGLNNLDIFLYFSYKCVGFFNVLGFIMLILYDYSHIYFILSFTKFLLVI